MIDYSVIIRTTGKAKEKYRALLDAIANLEPAPQEIIVVLPEGSREPQEKLGWETYYYSPKGMVIQRLKGIEFCKTKYALVCDDDIQFSSDFVKKLYEPVKEGFCKLSVGPLYSFLPPRGIKAILCSFIASASPTIFNKNRYISVLRSTGYSYNKKLELTERKYYETQSAPWTCFFGELDAIKRIRMEDEIWLDKFGYSAMDDQTMFYKAFLKGIKTITVKEAKYTHLDAQTSRKFNKKPVLQAWGFNRIVFWHRFLYCNQKNFFLKSWTTICFLYYLFWQNLYDGLDLFRKRLTLQEYIIKRKGYYDGWKYLLSEEYKQLTSVYEE